MGIRAFIEDATTYFLNMHEPLLLLEYIITLVQSNQEYYTI